LWVEKPEAQKLGFHSKADFATQAIREMLEKYSLERKACDKFLKMFRRYRGYLLDRDINNPSTFVDYLDKRMGTKF